MRKNWNMADTLPPDKKRSAGKNGSGKSGSVADFRYKRSFQQGGKGQRRPKGGPNGQSRTAQRPALADEKDNARGSNTAHAPSASQQRPSGDGRAPFRREAYAALDLGTNNCRLLIARPSGKDFTVIDAFSRVVRLGEDVATTGRLSDEAMDRTLSALSICADKLKRRNVRLARSVATEACRRAENGADFIERVRRETGIALDIISAEEEARLAVLGCLILLEKGTGPAIIFDIGGGSTELVLLESDGQSTGKIPRIIDWQSVPWGVVSLTDTVKQNSRDERGRRTRYEEMRRLVSESFAPFGKRIAEVAREDDLRLLGTSGTVTTLASLHLELPHYDRKAVDGLIVPSSAMRSISAELSSMSSQDRSELPCIGQDRASLVVAGCAILESILDLWPAERLGVADRGIREGILRSLMAAERQSEKALKSLKQSRSDQGAKP